ncbi:hypothetical protein NLI96_g10707 [Meripilus lineatus]|uniref:Uncharacterized protein n=1 Tax=Meripilus lineatus TaxID=2056292 RepID=A0AAD5UTA2_9APHY|nr:hypothetical protein NLI96_g10707 [Physisporinus lineatus]
MGTLLFKGTEDLKGWQSTTLSHPGGEEPIAGQPEPAGLQPDPSAALPAPPPVPPAPAPIAEPDLPGVNLFPLGVNFNITLLSEQHHIAKFGGIIKEGDPVSVALDSLGWKGTMNIREDAIKGKGVSVLCLLKEGCPVLLAKDACFTRTRHGCLRIKLVLQQGLQSVLGDVAQPSVQERSV